MPRSRSASSFKVTCEGLITDLNIGKIAYLNSDHYILTTTYWHLIIGKHVYLIKVHMLNN